MKLSFTEAAHRYRVARSSLYRWARDMWLAPYLVEGGLETDPPGCEPLGTFISGFRGRQGPRRAEEAPEPLEPAPQPDPFWSRWGRIAGPDEWPLSPDEMVSEALRLACALYEVGPDPDCAISADQWHADFAGQLLDALQDVRAGARWDEAAWQRAMVLMLLEEAPGDAASPQELRQALADGLVPADLHEAVAAALTPHGKPPCSRSAAHGPVDADAC